MSVVNNAMPLFTNHLQLPLFTGQRRWHTMFGQLNQLTSRGCTGTAATNADEDILADSNFVSLFDSSSEQVSGEEACILQAPYPNTRASCTPGCQTVEAHAELSLMDLVESNFPAVGENIDDAEPAMEQFMLDTNVEESDENANCQSSPVSVTDPECSHDVNLPALSAGEHRGQGGSVSASSGSESRTVRGRRHSDPGSIRSSITGSLSASSTSDNWYYYDRRLRPGGELAAHYGRLRARRSLSMIVFPPAYDAVVANAQTVQHTTDPSSEQLLTVLEPTGDNLTELPPPYHESEMPPSYAEVTDRAEQLDNAVSLASPTHNEYSQQSCAENWRVTHDNAMMRQCSNSHRMFVGRPAVRWNRNTSIERWTSSSFNWVMS